MIEMSRARTALLIVALFGAPALGGCCGGGPSHKCDFTPPSTGVDAGGPDALACGTKFCEDPQVCCVKKVPLVALCIDQADFVSDGCEKMDLPCLVPTDCPAGLVCCVALAPIPGVTCLPAQLCPGDGANTFLACNSDADCTRLGSTCQVVGTASDGISELKVCTP